MLGYLSSHLSLRCDRCFLTAARSGKKPCLTHAHPCVELCNSVTWQSPPPPTTVLPQHDRGGGGFAGGGGAEPRFQPFPPPSPQSSDVRQPERFWERLATGVWGYPHVRTSNDPHDALIVLLCVCEGGGGGRLSPQKAAGGGAGTGTQTSEPFEKKDSPLA